MRHLSVVLLTVFAVLAIHPKATGEPATKQVEVTNLPVVQDVSVTNEPLLVSLAPPVRMQLVGFTAATLMGDAGVFGFTRSCWKAGIGSAGIDGLTVNSTGQFQQSRCDDPRPVACCALAVPGQPTP